MNAAANGWEIIPVASPIRSSPDDVVAAPILGESNLPFTLQKWEDFERLLWRILRDVEGLRHAQLYGRPGQKQHGLDIVALAPNQVGTALQSKQYQDFKESDLNNAVKKFVESERPFDVQRFIIGVACNVQDNKVQNALIRHREDLYPIELELWGQAELSSFLRTHPSIVVEFFGLPTAEAFCRPFDFSVTEVPTFDAVAINEALARTPEETTGAGELFRSAKKSVENPQHALKLVEEGQALLNQAGFPAHAQQYEQQRCDLLVQLEQFEVAARDALDETWTKLSHGKTRSAEICKRRLELISKATPDNAQILELLAVAELAISIHLDPIGQVPNPQSLTLGNLEDRLRLAVLAGETALANHRLDWLTDASTSFTDLINQLDEDQLPVNQSLHVQLRLLISEAKNDWSSILEDARKLRLGYELGALVTARYARNRALNQHFEEADALWEEATGTISLKKRWRNASTWVFSRRAFRTRWHPYYHDDLLSLEIALSELGPSESILRGDDESFIMALEAFRNQKLRPAAIAAQRELRQATAISDWAGEERAHRLLGAIFTASEEPELAAHHLSRGADIEGMKELATQFPTQYIDVVASLDAPNYWTVATSYRLLAAEADLIPDDALAQITAHILAELENKESNSLIDLPGFTISRYLSSIETLASLADRLTESQASRVLDHFESQPPVKENHYRLHDKDEAITVARISLNHFALQKRAIAHLVPLLARSQQARKSIPLHAIDAAQNVAYAHLNILAQANNRWAQEILATFEVPTHSPESARAALERLTSPLVHASGTYTLGTNAKGDSLLIQGLSKEDRALAISELLRRVNDPLVSFSDRNNYLLAASNLVEGLDQKVRNNFFNDAIQLVSKLPPSEYDEFESQFSHKLGSLRISSRVDRTEPRLLYFAANLANTDTQRFDIKQRAYLLLGASETSDYWIAQALQILGDTIDVDLGFLAGKTWALRALTATRWVKHGVPEHLGQHLANDLDPRVRRAFAESLMEAENAPSHAVARRILSNDPAFSVRSIFQ